MALLEKLRLRNRDARVACRNEHGHRSTIVPLPRPNGEGVYLRTELGDLVLSPLEVGRLRDELRTALLRSAGQPAPVEDGEH